MILQENGYGKEVDLWSVGVLAMMLLGGGRAPFRKESLIMSDSFQSGEAVGGGGGGDGDASDEDGGGNSLSKQQSTQGTSHSHSHHHPNSEESGLSTAAVIDNITHSKFDFVPEEIWDRGERCVAVALCC